ncbi:MAG: PAS domain S-box protein [Dehalococcoidales bacterium]
MKDKTKKQLIKEPEAPHPRTGDVLRKNDEGFRTLIEHSSDIIQVVDSQGVIRYLSPSVQRILGYRPEELIGRLSIDVVHPDDLQKVAEGFAEALQKPGMPVVTECRCRAKDGTWLVLEGTGINYLDNPTVNGFLSCMHDTTERKQMEEALQASEARARSLIDDVLDSSGVGIIILDPDFRVVWVNRALERYLGLQKDEVIGKDQRELIRQRIKYIFEDPEGFASRILTAYDNNTYIDNLECHALPDAGREERWLEHWSLPVQSGFYAGGRIEHCYDITERKRAEGKIKLAYAEIERIFNTVSDAMRLIDKDFNILRVNDAYAVLTGVSKSEAVGKKCYEMFPGSRCHTPHCPLTRILGGEERVECEVENKRKSGTTVSCILTATPFRGSSSRLIGIVENFRDVTELRRTQEQLQHSQLLASLGEMTAGIAHEVNNPLGSVLLYSELLMASDALPQTKKDLKVIHDEAKRAAKIITDLLTYGRRVKPQMHRLNLHRIIKKALAMRQYEERVQNITVSTNLLNGPLYVKGDSSQFMQVFMNLMLNAEEALREFNGGNIIITTQIDGEWAKVSIADDGTGIPQENLERVFYPFFTTKRIGEGTGLGLSTCYGIVTGHHGLIRAEHNDMGGATFTVELPLAQARGQGSPPRKQKGKVGNQVTEIGKSGGGHGNKQSPSPGC